MFIYRVKYFLIYLVSFSHSPVTKMKKIQYSSKAHSYHVFNCHDIMTIIDINLFISSFVNILR